MIKNNPFQKKYKKIELRSHNLKINSIPQEPKSKRNKNEILDRNNHIYNWLSGLLIEIGVEWVLIVSLFNKPVLKYNSNLLLMLIMGLIVYIDFGKRIQRLYIN